ERGLATTHEVRDRRIEAEPGFERDHDLVNRRWEVSREALRAVASTLLERCVGKKLAGDQQEHCDDETAGRKSGSTKPDDDGNQAENHLERQELLRGDPGGRSGSCKSKLQVVDLRTRVEPES